MSTSTIDYDALAAQHGGKPAAVDYDALAQSVKGGKPAMTAPAGELRPQPDTGSNFFENAGNDLMHGGTRTIVGKGLGLMQGRGSKGYSGLEAGVSPSAAEFMGSVPLGIAQIGKGSAQVTEGHPINGMGNMIGGAAKASTIPLMLDAAPAARSAIEAIPSRAHAGQILSEIGEQAKDVPINLKNTMPAVNRLSELTDAGGKSAKPLNSLVKRTTKYLTPSTKGTAQDPILFPEARDIYSNVSDAARQSPLQTLMGKGLKPTMLRQAGIAKSGLNADLTDAAGTIGRGEDYTNALKEYANASKLRKMGILGGAAITEEGLRRSGILGKVASRVMP